MNLSLLNFPFLIFTLCMDQGQDLYSAPDSLEKSLGNASSFKS